MTVKEKLEAIEMLVNDVRRDLGIEMEEGVTLHVPKAPKLK